MKQFQTTWGLFVQSDESEARFHQSAGMSRPGPTLPRKDGYGINDPQLLVTVLDAFETEILSSQIGQHFILGQNRAVGADQHVLVRVEDGKSVPVAV
jgi:hypothetical protein